MKQFAFIFSILFYSTGLAQTPPSIGEDKFLLLVWTAILDTNQVFDGEEKNWDPILLADHFLPWHTASFEFPADQLPKSAGERQLRQGTEYDAYNMFYIYSAPFTDSLFCEEDRQAIYAQSENLNNCPVLPVGSNQFSLVNLKSSFPPVEKLVYAYSHPVFSKNGNIGVIRRYVFINDRELGLFPGYFKTFYFEWRDNLWKRLKAGPGVLNTNFEPPCH